MEAATGVTEMTNGAKKMLKVVTEINAILEFSRGMPFFAEELAQALGKASKAHGEAALAVIRLRAIPLDCGRVVVPA